MSLRNSAALLLFIVVLGGCATPRVLMPTPNVYVAGHEQLFGDLAEELKDHRVQLLYVTDRGPEQDESGRLFYGFERSSSTAFGTAMVEIGEGTSWERLVSQSLTRKRSEPIRLRMGAITELGRFPPTPYPFKARGGFVERDPEVVAEARARERELHAEINWRLALTPNKTIWLYVHGYNNTFDAAAFTLAESWHFLGREGVPILYSWPAGRGGLTGYAYDRESGEFTAYHLKQLVRSLANNDGVDKIKILAHSRGTDVTITALRELFIESRAAGIDPRARFKIASLVLAAPDLDFSIIQQRVMTEPIGPGVGQVTIYVSQGDRAIGLAEWLFGGLTRLGKLQFGDLGKKEIEIMEAEGALDIVDLRGEGGAFGHGYFHTNPASSSDLILTTRFEREAGAENGRPLIKLGPGFWAVDDDYLLLP